MALGHDIGDAHFFFDEPFEDRVQHLIGRQRILILLVLAQFGGRRFYENILRDHLAVRTERAFRLPAIAEFREPEHLHLVEILDRIEAAVHIAIDRRVANRHFRLVAGCHEHRAEFVRHRHQQRAARAALDIFFRGARIGAFKNRGEDLFKTFDHRARSAICRSEPLARARSAPASLSDSFEVKR